MPDPNDEVEIAKVAASVQFAISLLHQKITQLLKSMVPDIEKLDFNQSLDFLRKNQDQFFLDPKVRQSLVAKLQRARKVRNKYSHQVRMHHSFITVRTSKGVRQTQLNITSIF